LAQIEIAARELASGSSDRHWLDLQNAGLKLVTSMAIRLRIGPKARYRKPGGAVSIVPPPWKSKRRLRKVSGGSDRNFADLLEQTHDRRRHVLSQRHTCGLEPGFADPGVYFGPLRARPTAKFYFGAGYQVTVANNPVVLRRYG
jgi:hypothetical protein